jgi:hypothetical protein
MTAIIAGRLPKANFLIADAIVQPHLDVKSYKECKLVDKITSMELTEQFLVLVGEGIIAQAADLLSNWSSTQKIKYDLFKKRSFENIMHLASRFRLVHEAFGHQIIAQDKTDVYIAGRNEIKHYEVQFKDPSYIITNENYLKEGEVLMSYKGNLSLLAPPADCQDIRQYGITELEKEHARRKTLNSLIQKPLSYDFQGRFSSTILPVDYSFPVERQYPFEEITEVFLSFLPDWDLITNPSFKFVLNP